jgi:hypothetical protein
MRNLAHIGEFRLISIPLMGYIWSMENTEGSRAITQIFRARTHLQLRVSDRQMAIIIGSILGDAYIYPKGKICFEQAVSQRSYLLWKYAELKNLAYPRVSTVKRIDKRSENQTISIRFFLRQYFRSLREIFYLDGKKRIPPEIQEWFTPLAIVVWYMDDGYLDKGKYPLFMTENFSQEDTHFLSHLLEQTFHLKCFVTSKNRIRIRNVSAREFYSLIEPSINKDMRYKLP